MLKPRERAALIDSVIRQQHRLRSALMDGVSLPRLAQLDLTMAQLRAFLLVAHRGPLPVGELGHLLGVAKPTATLLVNALVRLDLVERHERQVDRRYTLVQLSPNGRELLDEVREGKREQLQDWLRQLGDADLRALAQGLDALQHVFVSVDGARSA